MEKTIYEKLEAEVPGLVFNMEMDKALELILDKILDLKAEISARDAALEIAVNSLM
jgi:hypothetical protein